MINIHSAKKLLNQIRPEIRMYWEKENGISLSGSIAEIELIDTEKMPCEDRIRTYRKAVKILFVTILFLFLAMVALACNYPHIRPVYPYTLGGLILIAVTAIACIQIHQIKLSDELREYRQNRINQQEILSSKVRDFWDTILKVSHGNTLHETEFVDEKYLKSFLLCNIKDLLLKEAIFRSQRYNKSFSMDTVSMSLDHLSASRSAFERNWHTVTVSLGVKMNRRDMFKQAGEEMKKTHPGLSDYIRTEEGKE